MNGKRIAQIEIQKMTELRSKGCSLPEIMRIMGRGSSTVNKYIRDVKILPEFEAEWRMKRGGSQYRAKMKWESAEKEATSLIKSLSKTENLLIAASLYWAEGTKKELNLINSDPLLIKTFASCLEQLGVERSEFRVTIRVYEDLKKEECVLYWANVLKIPKSQIINVNVLSGKKTGKLPYGMCRLRVTKGEKTFKLLQSAIKVIASKI